MLLKGYRKEMFRPECNPSFQSLHCVAHLDEDIGAVLPYLNAVLGGFQYFENPPMVMFKVHGKLIKIGSREIAVNALNDEAEAEKIMEWLRREINETWEKHEEIMPSVISAPQPQILEILKLLPKTNCRECGQPTCMVFAVQITEGAKGPEDCPYIDPPAREKLDNYLKQFPYEYYSGMRVYR
jgi:ArsR family metal-binding transcriptional regulator